MWYDGHVHVADDSTALVQPMMDTEGADRFSVLSCSQLDDDPVQNLAVLYTKKRNPGRCYAFCGLNHPKAGETTDYLEQLKAWLAAGFDGLKFLETKPGTQKRLNLRMDDMRFDPLFAYCEANAVPILWHVGDPATFWHIETAPSWAVERGWAYIDGTYLSLEEIYATVENVLDRHPNLKVTFAHFYFVSDDPEHAERMMTRYPNVRFDLTPGSEMYLGFTKDRAFFREFFIKYADRIQFGSDSEIGRTEERENTTMGREIRAKVERFLRTDDAYTAWGLDLRGFGLDEASLEKITHGTMTTFVGEAPKPLDLKAAEKACNATIALLDSRGDERAALARRLKDDIIK